MTKLYFPGANTGLGFFSRFDGILAPWSKPHYKYILKGGPGVGKNTLMRKVARRAADAGYDVEEFRCASDPDSLDAIRVPALGLILLDGTAPHSIDPSLPGIEGEILDLGRFVKKDVFYTHRAELEELFTENKACYRKAYALLSAARALHADALTEAEAVLDPAAVTTYIAEHLPCAQAGEHRALFTASATPRGIIDYSETHLPKNCTRVTGIVGEAVLWAAERHIEGKQAEICYGFIDPVRPYSIVTEESSLAVTDTGDTLERLCKAPLSAHAIYCHKTSRALAEKASTVLANALSLHDRIEAIYRPFVDYDHVNRESEVLLDRLDI